MNGFKTLDLEVRGKALANLSFKFDNSTFVLYLRKNEPPAVVASHLRELAAKMEKTK